MIIFHRYLVDLRFFCSSKFIFPFCFFYLWFCYFFFFFLYFEAIVFLNDVLCSSFVSGNMLEVLMAKVIVFFSCEVTYIFLKCCLKITTIASKFNVLDYLYQIILNAKMFWTYFGEWNFFSLYLSSFLFCLHPLSYKIALHFILFKDSSIFSMICNL